MKRNVMKTKLNAMVLIAAGVYVLACTFSGFGQSSWKRVYGDSSIYNNPLIVKTTDGNFLVGASPAPVGSSIRDIWIMKIRPNGDTLWAKIYKETDDDYLATRRGKAVFDLPLTTGAEPGRSILVFCKLVPSLPRDPRLRFFTA
jgi:hypothetical protein